MKAAVRFQGKTHLVHKGQILTVDRLPNEINTEITIPDVLLTIDGDKVEVGKPTLDSRSVTAKVVAHERGDKIRVATFRHRKREHRVQGFRAAETTIQITDLK